MTLWSFFRRNDRIRLLTKCHLTFWPPLFSVHISLKTIKHNFSANLYSRGNNATRVGVNDAFKFQVWELTYDCESHWFPWINVNSPIANYDTGHFFRTRSSKSFKYWSCFFFFWRVWNRFYGLAHFQWLDLKRELINARSGHDNTHKFLLKSIIDHCYFDPRTNVTFLAYNFLMIRSIFIAL